ncbi:hypothetical protein CDAR_570691 [Caerostris darwini]|uniref:Uncharacterized protein n=1 Tax=Caerostris darwini TaxID=1538125 RepID=A0AAV4QG26_9ARAC|nr:hypothetical protein CDAR_570691 [Caerostris darwini]
MECHGSDEKANQREEHGSIDNLRVLFIVPKLLTKKGEEPRRIVVERGEKENVAKTKRERGFPNAFRQTEAVPTGFEGGASVRDVLFIIFLFGCRSFYTIQPTKKINIIIMII